MATIDDRLPPGESPELLHEDVHDPRRRDFLNVAAVSLAGVGGLAIVLPLINQMSPSADVLAQSTTEVDLTKIDRRPRVSSPPSASSRCSCVT